MKNSAVYCLTANVFIAQNLPKWAAVVMGLIYLAMAIGMYFEERRKEAA